MGGTLGFSDRPEQIWLKAGWAFRQVLEDTLVRCPDDTEMREAFERAEWFSDLDVQSLPAELAERVVTALRETIVGILSGTIETGLVTKPYGDTTSQTQYKEALRELLEIIPTKFTFEVLEQGYMKADSGGGIA